MFHRNRQELGNMKPPLKFAALCFLVASTFCSHAQTPALPPSFYRTLLAVLSQSPAFYGRAQVQISNGAGKDPTSINCSIAVLSGTMRFELDSFPISPNLPAAEALNLRQMHTITILRPDLNRCYTVYPEFKSYLETAYGSTAVVEAIPLPKVERSPGTKEMVGIQACTKSQWNILENNQSPYNVTVWTATNLNNFPIRIKSDSPATVLDFTDLHMENPNGNSFVPPASYVKYEGIQQLIQKDVEKQQAQKTTPSQ
jgi:hypothetical protein